MFIWVSWRLQLIFCGWGGGVGVQSHFCVKPNYSWGWVVVMLGFWQKALFSYYVIPRSLDCPRLTIHKHLMSSLILFYSSIIVYMEPYVTARSGQDYRQFVRWKHSKPCKNATWFSLGYASWFSLSKYLASLPPLAGEHRDINVINLKLFDVQAVQWGFLLTLQSDC